MDRKGWGDAEILSEFPLDVKGYSRAESLAIEMFMAEEKRDTRRAVYSSLSSFEQFILKSLLALNSGASAALLALAGYLAANTTPSDPRYLLLPLGFFGVSIVLIIWALLSMFEAQRIYHRYYSSNPLWFDVDFDDLSVKKGLELENGAASKLWTSFHLFVGGLVATAVCLLKVWSGN